MTVLANSLDSGMLNGSRTVVSTLLPTLTNQPVREVNMANDLYPAEEWRQIPDFPAYSVSSLGRIRRDLGVRTSKAGKILRGHIRRTYQGVNLSHNGKASVQSIHRLVALVFIGPPPTPQHQVAHGDGDRTNNSLRNLRWATAVENAADRAMHGNQYEGTRHHSSKITPDTVREIRRLRMDGVPRPVLARRHGLSTSIISRITMRKCWKSVT